MYTGFSKLFLRNILKLKSTSLDQRVDMMKKKKI